MRFWIVVAVLGLVGCGGSPLCGVDDEGEDVPICEVQEGAVTFQYCPGNHWGDADGCNSCGCQPDGTILCTAVVAEDCESPE